MTNEIEQHVKLIELENKYGKTQRSTNVLGLGGWNLNQEISIPLRGGQSKHQRKVLEIFSKVESRDLDGLHSIKHINCTGSTEIVAYCRYLQHCINILKNEGA